jgi:hypothetical protein
MQIVTVQALVDFPPGTVFSGYEPCIVSGLYRLDPSEQLRGEPGARYVDFFYTNLLADCTEAANGRADALDAGGLELADGGGRWGNFDPDELFIVYEPADLLKLIGILQEGVASAPA